MSTVEEVEDRSEAGPHPFTEWPWVGAAMAFVAGSCNAWTLFNASTFATVQSGNVASSGIFLADGNWPKFWFAWCSVLSFGLGSLICGILMTKFKDRGRSFSVAVLLSEAVILLILALVVIVSDASNNHDTVGLFGQQTSWHGHYIALGISFVAGAQGNAFHKVHGMLYGNVAVTFVVQMAFNFLIQARFKRDGIHGEPNIMWSGIFFFVLFGFASGGFVGSLLVHWLGGSGSKSGWELLLPIVVLIGLAGMAASQRTNADPSPGGSFA
ncbi:uncharacterized membrane protein YoaK (UPF0700 family) [Branchiibius hedensis]|uniref:Uncharacterized membrane protein YoaK, UPF0700 family n=1 Tax=Branchiibius hedensis TaxID=672460 RepID=A0A2Y9A224_9MICO|nr:YoaK family protein [Branchiibius hedensis]PWJ27447.1 uncharacterized membrane protein YoaK (UPF0700 family) [Branchiibius hedensis]SSA36257.1 Uncharacterized membrane protein YoaK, UPF0700 family [Branchiibius hedensis]